MKVMAGSRRCHYAARVSIFFIMAALIAGIGGCTGCSHQHQLTITSTVGGNVTEPGEGTFIYDEGAVVNLVAEAEAGYGFVRWTCSCDASIFADIGVATTTVTMSGNHYITARFGRIVEVRDWHDLDAIRDNLDGYYLLMNDLDSTTPGYAELAGPSANEGKGWQPLGAWSLSAFTGSFDGQGHQIRDLYINRPDETGIGIFGVVDGAIRDIGAVNGSVTGGAIVGGLAGWNTGAVSHCYFSGSVTGAETTNGVGGLVGSNDQGMLKATYSTGTVTGNYNVGGLLGEQYGGGVVTACYSTSNVVGNTSVGGLVGMNTWSAVTDSYCTGGVAGIQIVGGLVGDNAAGTVSDSYSAGGVAGDSYVGGLVGHKTKETSLDHCFWDIDSSGWMTSAGGIGESTGRMKDISPFSEAGWSITAVADIGARNTAYIWNIVDGVTYPFLSWQSI